MTHNSWCSSDGTLQAMVALTAMIAGFNGYDESESLACGLLGALLAVLARTGSFAVAAARKCKGRDARGTYVATYITVGLGVLAYTGHLVTGPSDPNTAGHMHVVLFPLVHLILALILLALGLLWDGLRARPVA